MKLRNLGATLAAALLAACGGGGSDEWPFATFPVAKTFEQAFVGPFEVTLSGPSDTTLRVIRTPTGLASSPRRLDFEAHYGVSASATSEVIAVYRNGSYVSSASRQLYYSPAGDSVRLLGASRTNDQYCDFVEDWPGLTSRAADGESFTFYSVSSRRGDCSPTDPAYEHSEGTWRIDRDSANTAFVCIMIDTVPSRGQPEEQCYHVDTAGAILGVQVSTYVDGKLWVFR